MFLEDARVAVVLIHVPADEGIGRAPGRVGRPRAPDVGDRVRDLSFLVLDVADVADEVRVEGGHVEVHDGFLGRALGVAHPAHALVALVAIGRDAVKVGLLAPGDDALEAVEDVLGGGEAADGIDGRVNDAAADRIELGRSGEARDLDVAEAVIGEARLPDLLAGALEDVVVLGLGRAQGFLVERAVLVKELGEAEPDVRAPRPLGAEAGPAAEVLAHVENVNARKGTRHLERDDGIDDLDGRHQLGRKRSLRSVDRFGRRPVFIVEAGTVPAGRFPASVVRFPVVDAVREDGAVGGLPGRIGDDAHGAAVLELDVELEEEGPRLVPAVAEGDSDRVGAFADERRHVIGRVEDALVVGRPSGIEDVVAGLPAIEAQLVVAEAGDVGPGPLDPALEAELLAELVLPADPSAFPVALGEKPGVESRHGAPGALAAVPVPGADLPEIRLAALERLPGEGDLRGLGRGDLPAVPDIPRGGLGVGRDDDLIGRLDLAAFRVPVDPEEARLRHVDAHRVDEIFAAQGHRGQRPGTLGGRRGEGGRDGRGCDHGQGREAEAQSDSQAGTCGRGHGEPPADSVPPNYHRVAGGSIGPARRAPNGLTPC